MKNGVVGQIVVGVFVGCVVVAVRKESDVVVGRAVIRRAVVIGASSGEGLAWRWSVGRGVDFFGLRWFLSGWVVCKVGWWF